MGSEMCIRDRYSRSWAEKLNILAGAMTPAWRSMRGSGRERPNGLSSPPDCLKDTDPRRELRPEFPVRDSNVVIGLQVQPEPWLHAEEQPEPKRGVRRDWALAIDQLADPLLGETSMSAASWRALMPMGFINSSSRISPG